MITWIFDFERNCSSTSLSLMAWTSISAAFFNEASTGIRKFSPPIWKPWPE